MVVAIYILSTMFGVGQVEHGNVSFDISPDGSQIVFSAADGDIYTLNLGTMKVTPLINTPFEESSPSYSPDGKKVAYSQSDAKNNYSSIYLLDLATRETTCLTGDQKSYDTGPSFSADGKQIAFSRAHRHRPYSMGGWTWDDWDICVINADGSKLKRISQSKYYGAKTPRFVDKGGSILFTADANRPAGDLAATLWEVPVSGAKPPKQLIVPPVAGRAGAWASAAHVSKD